MVYLNDTIHSKDENTTYYEFQIGNINVGDDRKHYIAFVATCGGGWYVRIIDDDYNLYESDTFDLYVYDQKIYKPFVCDDGNKYNVEYTEKHYEKYRPFGEKFLNMSDCRHFEFNIFYEKSIIFRAQIDKKYGVDYSGKMTGLELITNIHKVENKPIPHFFEALEEHEKHNQMRSTIENIIENYDNYSKVQIIEMLETILKQNEI